MPRHWDSMKSLQEEKIYFPTVLHQKLDSATMKVTKAMKEEMEGKGFIVDDTTCTVTMNSLLNSCLEKTLIQAEPIL